MKTKKKCMQKSGDSALNYGSTSELNYIKSKGVSVRVPVSARVPVYIIKKLKWGD